MEFADRRILMSKGILAFERQLEGALQDLVPESGTLVPRLKRYLCFPSNGFAPEKPMTLEQEKAKTVMLQKLRELKNPEMRGKEVILDERVRVVCLGLVMNYLKDAHKYSALLKYFDYPSLTRESFNDELLLAAINIPTRPDSEMEFFLKAYDKTKIDSIPQLRELLRDLPDQFLDQQASRSTIIEYGIAVDLCLDDLNRMLLNRDCQPLERDVIADSPFFDRLDRRGSSDLERVCMYVFSALSKVLKASRFSEVTMKLQDPENQQLADAWLTEFKVLVRKGVPCSERLRTLAFAICSGMNLDEVQAVLDEFKLPALYRTVEDTAFARAFQLNALVADGRRDRFVTASEVTDMIRQIKREIEGTVGVIPLHDGDDICITISAMEAYIREGAAGDPEKVTSVATRVFNDALFPPDEILNDEEFHKKIIENSDKLAVVRERQRREVIKQLLPLLKAIVDFRVPLLSFYTQNITDLQMHGAQYFFCENEQLADSPKSKLLHAVLNVDEIVSDVFQFVGGCFPKLNKEADMLWSDTCDASMILFRSFLMGKEIEINRSIILALFAFVQKMLREMFGWVEKQSRLGVNSARRVIRCCLDALSSDAERKALLAQMSMFGAYAGGYSTEAIECWLSEKPTAMISAVCQDLLKAYFEPKLLTKIKIEQILGKCGWVPALYVRSQDPECIYDQMVLGIVKKGSFQSEFTLFVSPLGPNYTQNGI